MVLPKPNISKKLSVVGIALVGIFYLGEKNPEQIGQCITLLASLAGMYMVIQGIVDVFKVRGKKD